MINHLKNPALVALGAIALTNCQDNPPAIDSNTAATVTVEVVATIELETPDRIVDAAFAPDNIAKWKSEILLLSDAGTLYRATTNDTKISTVDGQFSDITGLDMGENRVGFLGLKPDGQLTAYQRNSETESFEKTLFSGPDQAYTRLCTGSVVNPQKIWALKGDNALEELSIDVSDTGHIDVSVTANQKAPTRTLHCASAADGQISVQDQKSGKTKLLQDGKWMSLSKNTETGPYSLISSTDSSTLLSASANSGNLSLINDGHIQDVSIVDGLGISGMPKPGLALATDINLGSTFSEGAVLVADAETGRIILIAKPYFEDITVGTAN